MKKIIIITRREFLMMITRKAYIFSLVGIPILMLAFAIVVKYLKSHSEASRHQASVGVIDQAGVIDFNLAESALAQAGSEMSDEPSQSRRVAIRSYSQLVTGLRDLQEGNLSVLCAIETDFIRSGQVKLYTRNIWVGGTQQGLAEFRALMRASLLQRFLHEKRVDDKGAAATAQRALAPIKLSKITINNDGTTVAAESRWKKIRRYMAPYGLTLLLIITAAMSSSYMLKSTSEEKENRVIEIMLSAVRPEQLLWGKILGLGGAALLQGATYIVLIGITVLYYGGSLEFTLGGMVLSLVYCLIGYLLYAGLLAAIGVLGDNMDKSQLSHPLIVIMLLPMILEFMLLDEPNGALARALTYFPLTAPVTMIYRLPMAQVPALDVIISLGLLLVSVYLAVRCATKIFRTAALMYGKRVTMTEIARWLREA